MAKLALKIIKVVERRDFVHSNPFYIYSNDRYLTLDERYRKIKKTHEIWCNVAVTAQHLDKLA